MLPPDWQGVRECCLDYDYKLLWQAGLIKNLAAVIKAHKQRGQRHSRVPLPASLSRSLSLLLSVSLSLSPCKLNYVAWKCISPCSPLGAFTYDNGRQRLIRRGSRVKASEKVWKALPHLRYPTQLQRNKRNKRNRNTHTCTHRYRQKTYREKVAHVSRASQVCST